jgi:outer membrane biosynthesis protein TonB
MSLAFEPMALELDLPWQADEQREKAFKDALKRTLIPLLILFIVVPFLPKVDLGYLLDDDVPVRTQILLEPIVEPKPEPIPQPKPVAPAKQPKAPASPEAAAKSKLKKSVSQSQGLMELSRQLSAARSAVDISSMQNKNLSSNEGGQVARTERARLGEDLATKSSGVSVSGTVMQGEMTQLAGHQTAAVEGVVMNGLPAGEESSYLSNQTGQRDMESIRRTLEQAKGNVYALYQQALRDNPGLTGEFTFELVIEPNGSISELTLLVSELGIGDLEQSILNRIRNVNFGVMDVSPTVVEYRFVFLPS